MYFTAIWIRLRSLNTCVPILYFNPNRLQYNNIWSRNQTTVKKFGILIHQIKNLVQITELCRSLHSNQSVLCFTRLNNDQFFLDAISHDQCDCKVLKISWSGRAKVIENYWLEMSRAWNFCGKGTNPTADCKTTVYAIRNRRTF